MANNSDDTPQEKPDEKPELDVTADDFVAGPDDRDPVSKAYARVGRPDTSGVSGLSESDEDAGEQRRDLYKKGAKLVSRID